MGGATLSTPKRGRALDAAINVVPFIDLLSCCISFLIITATTLQLSRLHAKPGADAAGAEIEPVPAPPALEVAIAADGYLCSRDGDVRAIPRRAGDFDLVALADALGAYKRARPDDDRVRLRAADSVAYREVIRAMDTAVAQRFESIGLESGASQDAP
jgi:biopolymer transport protein ExbD